MKRKWSKRFIVQVFDNSIWHDTHWEKDEFSLCELRRAFGKPYRIIERRERVVTGK